MRPLRLLPLLVLPALFLGATCVTRIEQKGPTGPWIGEVTNTGNTLAPDIHVYGWFQGADEDWVGGIYTKTCPFDLLPGQKGYFVKSAINTRADLALPFSLASVDSYTCQQHALTTDVNVRVISMSEDHKSALVEAINDSHNAYWGLSACGLSFTPSGEVQDMAINSDLPVEFLGPGDKVRVPLNFHTPATGQIEFAVESAFGTYDTVLDSSHFEVSASRVVQTDQGRELRVVGEVLNDSAVDLVGAQYEAYLGSSPTVRASGRVGLASGFIPAGESAPVVFSLPRDRNDSTRVQLAGVVAIASSEAASRIPVTNVSSSRLRPDVVGDDLVAVTATLTNPFDTDITFSVCFELRGAGGKLVGASCESSCGPHPNESWTATRIVEEVDRMESVEVIAYARPGMCAVTPPSDPDPPPCGPIPGPSGTPISPD